MRGYAHPQHIDLEPFNAFTPSELQKIRKQSKTMSGMYIIKCDGQAPSRKSKSRCSYTVVEQGLNAEGRRVAHERAKAQLSLIHEIEGELEDIEAVFYSHDGPWQFVGHEYVGLDLSESSRADVPEKRPRRLGTNRRMYDSPLQDIRFLLTDRLRQQRACCEPIARHNIDR